MFVAVALNLEYETFVIHVAFLNSILFNVYFFCRTQISDLIAKKAPTIVSNKYVNFADMFSLNLASKILKHIKINDYAIELVDGKQPLYRPIYSLRPVELETLKTYIETNLANRFIRLSKSFLDTPILFDRKLDGSFWLCINYKGVNNL